MSVLLWLSLLLYFTPASGPVTAPVVTRATEEPAMQAPAPAPYRRLTPQQARERRAADAAIILLDVRTEAEHRRQRIPGSLLIPVTDIERLAPEKLPDRSAILFVYCRSGNRSRAAAHKLLVMGYTEVYDIGGIIDWPFETEAD